MYRTITFITPSIDISSCIELHFHHSIIDYIVITPFIDLPIELYCYHFIHRQIYRTTLSSLYPNIIWRSKGQQLWLVITLSMSARDSAWVFFSVLFHHLDMWHCLASQYNVRFRAKVKSCGVSMTKSFAPLRPSNVKFQEKRQTYIFNIPCWENWDWGTILMWQPACSGVK